LGREGKTISKNLTGRSDENHEKPQSGEPASRPRIELETSRTQRRNIAKFDTFLCVWNYLYTVTSNFLNLLTLYITVVKNSMRIITMVIQAEAAAIQPISQMQGAGTMILNIQHRVTIIAEAEQNGLLMMKT
jgi:hypothetical protein